jgi:hypothetical protein
MSVAWRMARFAEEVDPYEFRDNLRMDESVEEGVQRAAFEACSDLRGGGLGRCIDWLEGFDPEDLDKEQAKERKSLLKELRALSKG